MAAAKKIRMLLVDREITLAELAKRLGKHRSTISDKMRRDNFSENDLKEIADVLNYDYEAVFIDRETGKKF